MTVAGQVVKIFPSPENTKPRLTERAQASGLGPLHAQRIDRTEREKGAGLCPCKVIGSGERGVGTRRGRTPREMHPSRSSLVSCGRATSGDGRAPCGLCSGILREKPCASKRRSPDDR